MAENNLSEAVAVVYDGVGFGLDGHSWGSEIFVINKKSFSRVAHWSYLPMPGGDLCVEEPLRIAQAALLPAGIELPGQAFVAELIEKKINLHQSCGMGRLFDAASALLGICTHPTYEGQAAMMLEAASAPLNNICGYDIQGLHSIRLLEALAKDTSPIPLRVAKFHATLILETARVIEQTVRASGISTVVLSGGCFQNKRLFEGLISTLKHPILIKTHRLIPMNDGGISFGQLAYAALEVN